MVEIDLCPRSVLCRLGVPSRVQRDVSILVSSLLVFLLLPAVRYIPHLCLMQTLLDLPCPGCGVTHAITAACRFNLAQAWASNPGGLALAAFLALQALARPVAILSSRMRPVVDQLSRYGSGIVLTSLLMVWIHRLHHHLL